MAVYNELQVGRYVRFLQKLFSIKGRQPAPLTFSGEIGALLSLFHGAENRYLEGWDLFGTGFLISAVAAQNSAVRFRMPSNSNVIAVITSMIMATGTNDSLIIEQGATAADLGTLGGSTPRFDARARPNPNLITSFGNNAATLGTQRTDTPLIAVTPFQFIAFEDQEMIVAPGDAIQAREVNLNTNLFFTVWWRERALEDSEQK